MNCEYTGVWRVLYDWQSLFAGVLALLAGIAAYCAGRRQAKAVEDQNRAMKRSESRRLARETLVSARLLDGILARLKDEISHAKRLLQQPQYQNSVATAPTSWRKLLHKPHISVVWDKLGLCEPEIIRNYMNLDAEIEQYWEREILSAEYQRGQLEQFHVIVNTIRELLDREAQRCNMELAK